MEIQLKISNLHYGIVIKLSLFARWTTFFFVYLRLFIFLLLFRTGGASRPRRRVRYPKLVGQFVTVPGTLLIQLHLKIDTFILLFAAKSEQIQLVFVFYNTIVFFYFDVHTWTFHFMESNLLLNRTCNHGVIHTFHMHSIIISRLHVFCLYLHTYVHT